MVKLLNKPWPPTESKAKEGEVLPKDASVSEGADADAGASKPESSLSLAVEGGDNETNSKDSNGNGEANGTAATVQPKEGKDVANVDEEEKKKGGTDVKVKKEEDINGSTLTDSVTKTSKDT